MTTGKIWMWNIKFLVTPPSPYANFCQFFHQNPCPLPDLQVMCFLNDSHFQLTWIGKQSLTWVTRKKLFLNFKMAKAGKLTFFSKMRQNNLLWGFSLSKVFNSVKIWTPLFMFFKNFANLSVTFINNSYLLFSVNLCFVNYDFLLHFLMYVITWYRVQTCNIFYMIFEDPSLRLICWKVIH